MEAWSWCCADEPQGKSGGRCDELSALHSRIAVCILCKNRSQAVCSSHYNSVSILCIKKWGQILKTLICLPQNRHSVVTLPLETNRKGNLQRLSSLSTHMKTSWPDGSNLQIPLKSLCWCWPKVSTVALSSTAAIMWAGLCLWASPAADMSLLPCMRTASAVSCPSCQLTPGDAGSTLCCAWFITSHTAISHYSDYSTVSKCLCAREGEEV